MIRYRNINFHFSNLIAVSYYFHTIYRTTKMSSQECGHQITQALQESQAE